MTQNAIVTQQLRAPFPGNTKELRIIKKVV